MTTKFYCSVDVATKINDYNTSVKCNTRDKKVALSDTSVYNMTTEYSN